MQTQPNLSLVDQMVLINRPIASVFTFVSNHENYIHWFPGVVSIASADQQAHGTVGKVYRETLRLPTGRQQAMDIAVVSSQPPELFVTEGTFAPLHPRMEIRLTATSAHATRLNLRFFSRNPSTIARWLIGMLVKPTFNRQSGRGLQKLKTLLEAQTP